MVGSGREASVTLVDLDPGEPRLESKALAVLRELRPQLTAESFRGICALGFEQGLRFSGAYLGDRCVAGCGWRILHNTSAGTKLYVDDLVTTAGARGRGVGSFILAQTAERAKDEHDVLLDLDSGVHRHDAHRFYLCEGMERSAIHFRRPIR
jgi:GNAT superfamily N-acetyltransferase